MGEKEAGELIAGLQRTFVSPLRISYTSPRFTHKDPYRGEEPNRPWHYFDGKKHTYYTAYEHRKTVPAHFTKWFRESKFGDCLLWDPKPPNPPDIIKYRRAVRGCIKQIYQAYRAAFVGVYERDSEYPRHGCETLEDAEAEAWIFCIDNQVFGRAEQAKNPDAYIWEAIKRHYIRKVNNDKKSKVTKNGQSITVTQFSTVKDEMDYGHTLDGIEGHLVDRAVGRSIKK
jgi:hypothetical protein